MASTYSPSIRSTNRIAVIRNSSASNRHEGTRGNFRDNEACYSNCSYVGFHWDNKLGLARF